VSLVGAVTLAVATVGTFVGAVVFDGLLRRAGRPDLVLYDATAVAFVLAAVGAGVTGLVLTVHRPGHPVGWLLGGLALSIGLSGLADGWSAYGALARPESAPGAGFAAAYSVAGFVPWVSLVSVILLLVPDGRPPGRRARWWLPATVAGGVLLMLLQATSPVFPDPSLAPVPNPLAVSLPFGLRGVLLLAAAGTVVACLIAGIVAVVVRYRRGGSGERRRLLWVALAAVLLPVPTLLVVGALVIGHDVVLASWFAGGYIALLPLAVGLSVLRFDLFDVDVLVRRAVTYTIVSVVLVAAYGALVVTLGWALASVSSGGSAVAVAGATLGVAVMFAPVRRVVQDRVDRRFNRRRYEAAAVLRQFAAGQGPAGETVREALARAVDDDDLRLGLWLADEARCVDLGGEPIDIDGPRVEVRRDGELIAVVGHRGDPVTAELVRTAAAEASTELDNARLRAAIRAQLVEVQRSRRRIVTAGLAERRKIERNLHDGAQQRLVALAMRLRAAQFTLGAPAQAAQGRPRSEGAATKLETPRDTAALLDATVTEITTAVAELRDLANGLLPALLTADGLAAALEDFADRCGPNVDANVDANATVGATVEVRVPERRFPGDVEAALYFVACEAVTNAVKHAAATTITVDITTPPGTVVLRVCDDGRGGADPTGGGLRGLADRAAALGGRLTVASSPDGTVVRAELPCGS
jgi:signal transduction histidine kinase